MSLNVLIAEDHTLVRSGIRALLESAPDVTVMGEAGNGRQAVELARALGPGLVLMDVGMPELNGIEAARQIHGTLPAARILMLSMHEDRQYVFESLKAGAAGYVLKGAAFQELLVAISTVMGGKNYISPALAGAVIEDYISRAQGGVSGQTALGRLSGPGAGGAPADRRGQEQRRGRRGPPAQRPHDRHAPPQPHDQARDPLDRRADQVRHPPRP